MKDNKSTQERILYESLLGKRQKFIKEKEKGLVNNEIEVWLSLEDLNYLIKILESEVEK